MGNTGPIKGPGSGSGSGSGNVGFDEHRNTPFKEFSGCTASKKNDITQSWWDLVQFVRLAASIDFSKKPGTLESRVFGYDVHERPGAADFIHSELPGSQLVPPRSANLCYTEIYANILKLYDDKVYGKIRIGCQDLYQTHRSKYQQTNCKAELADGEVGGYAFSYSEKLEDNTIVMCDPFFRPGQELFEPKLKELRGNKAYQKDTRQLNGKFHMLLHELTHLAAMSETSTGKRLQSSSAVIHGTHQNNSGRARPTAT
jgi:hypothetical protein